MKRRIAGFIAIGLLIGSLTGCGNAQASNEEKDKVSVEQTMQEEVKQEWDDLLESGTIVAIDKEAKKIHLRPHQVEGKENFEEIILNVSDSTAIVDGETGEAVSRDDLQEGDEIYVWISPQFALSDPPQTAAQAIIINGADIPVYQTVESLEAVKDKIVIKTAEGIEWEFDNTLVPKLYPSNEDTKVTTIKKGSKCLIWPKQIPVAYDENTQMQGVSVLIVEP